MAELLVDDLAKEILALVRRPRVDTWTESECLAQALGLQLGESGNDPNRVVGIIWTYYKQAKAAKPQ